MAQTFTLCHDAALTIPSEPAKGQEVKNEPSARVLQNILDFSRNLEVRNSVKLKQVYYLKS